MLRSILRAFIALPLLLALTGPPALAGPRDDLARYQALLDDWKSQDQADAVRRDLMEMEQWIATAFDHWRHGRLTDIPPVFELLEAQTRLIQARMTTARSEDARTRSERALAEVERRIGAERTEIASLRRQRAVAMEGE
ncbi:MAG: hypothetical protein KC620_24955 [Myxococcales bacterium]|nr:hypothetical protein [Myxococcales bacterium]